MALPRYRLFASSLAMACRMFCVAPSCSIRRPCRSGAVVLHACCKYGGFMHCTGRSRRGRALMCDPCDVALWYVCTKKQSGA